MFGFEIPFLIAAIVTAYPCLTEFFRDWRRKHHERRTLRAHHKLEQVLEASPTEVRSIRDELRLELAEACYRGDENACKELKERLAAADKTIMTLLKTDKDSSVRRYHDPISQLLSNVQRKVLSDMKHPTQRRVYSSRVNPSHSLTRHLDLSPASRQASHTPRASNRQYNCSSLPIKMKDSNGTTYHLCKDCGWTNNPPQCGSALCDGGLYPRTRDNRSLDWSCLRQKFHYASSKGSSESCRYRCSICQDRVRMSLGALIEHIRAYHRWSDICDGDCTNTSGKCGKNWRREDEGCRAHGVSLSYR